MKSFKSIAFLLLAAVALGWLGRGIVEEKKKESLVRAIATIQMKVPKDALDLLEKEKYRDLKHHLGISMCNGFITYENNEFLADDERTKQLFNESYAYSGHLLKKMQSEPAETINSEAAPQN